MERTLVIRPLSKDFSYKAYSVNSEEDDESIVFPFLSVSMLFQSHFPLLSSLFLSKFQFFSVKNTEIAVFPDIAT